MNKVDWNLWSEITFKTQAYRKNFDIINTNENFITEYDGSILELRVNKKKPPRQIGEYGFSVWNIGLGKKFAVDFNRLIKEHAFENTYEELMRVVKKKEIKISDYKKIVLIHTFVLNKEYRKHGITEEFIEMMYRDFYGEDVAIIMLVKPFQDNAIDADYFFNHKTVRVKESVTYDDVQNIPAMEYYSLNELTEKKDVEFNEYKLFALANRCGFNRINESYLFLFSPEKIEKRMQEKQKYAQHTVNE